ncbi:DUF2939 domain-containing protein [Afipia sp. GAS231]|uniref:DUF2939 domain-containing protein n=1 Tax=Afipia sp. GAS231 TaxID=1882747 RepID=UPI00087BCC03|nr:DUF2939 domain-containing protein [Afipia sp. GAS231]SDN69649.1 Protein of unknown function [Afipia sp. GAS231]
MRWFLTSIVAVVVATGVYAGSAIVSLNGLVGAAKAGNGAEILARTDVPRLKRSLVDQIVAAYLIRTCQNRPIKPIERLLANTYGATIADALVAKMLTAENLTNILQNGSLGADGDSQMIALAGIDTSKVLESLGRLSLVKPVELSIRLGDEEGAGAISLHFEGNGWKLSGLNLPTRAVEQLAMGLQEARPGKG